MAKLKALGFVAVNPFDDEEKIEEKYNAKQGYYSNPSEQFAMDIVDNDFLMVFSCDHLLAWFPKTSLSIGTPIEMFWAKTLGKKVISICGKPHPFVLRYSDQIYSSVEEFLSTNHTDIII